MPRWVSENAEPLFLAFVLSLVVWLAGVNASDPIQEGLFPDPVAITYHGPSAGFVATSTLPGDATLTLRAPLSVWSTLTAADLRLQADLENLGPGTHAVPLQASVGLPSVRVRSVEPATISVTL